MHLVGTGSLADRRLVREGQVSLPGKVVTVARLLGRATISGSPISPPSPILSEMSPSLPGIVVVASLYLCCPKRWFGPQSAATARSIASHLTDPKALVRSWKAVSDFNPSRSSLHVVACLIRTADSRRLPGMLPCSPSAGVGGVHESLLVLSKIFMNCFPIEGNT